MPPTTRSYITRIGTAVPAHKVRQSDAASFMSRTVARHNGQGRRIQALYRATRIQERYSVLEDFSRDEGFTFFPDNPDLSPFPSTAQRMARYRREAPRLAAQAVRRALGDESLDDITHLITVSCTGMYAPGLDIDLVKELGLPGTVERTCINFMGCYAAFNALKVADAAVKARPSARVLIVSVELCSLHFQKDLGRDQVLANSLFSDGTAAVLIEGQPRAGWNYCLDAFHNQLIPEGEQDMAWAIVDTGFEMRLSAYVPNLLAGAAQEAVDALLRDLAVNPEEIERFALHPGGRRVLEALESALGIPKEKNATSYEVLAHYGNMSSATVLFVLEATLDQSDLRDGERVLSMAFGPGLTLESALLHLEHHA